MEKEKRLSKGTNLEGKTPSSKSSPNRAAVKKASAGKKKRKRPPKRSKQKEWWAAPVITLMSIVLIMAGYVVVSETRNYVAFAQMRNAVNTERFYKGITVEGTDMSQMSYNQALQLWSERENEIASGIQINMQYEGRSWTLSSEDIGYHSDYQQVLKHAFAIGRSGSLESRYEFINAIDQNEHTYRIERGYDPEKIKQRISEINQEVGHKGSDAKVSGFDAENGTLIYTSEQEGFELDIEAVSQRIFDALDGNLGVHNLQLDFRPVQPKVTVKTLEQQYGKITSATTSASSSSSNRLTNIKIACKAIDGFELKPGEVFSFNEVVGERTTDRGYKKAGVFSNGMLDSGVGGGICQVSTTLFNAVAKADLEIVECHPHSRPVSYVDIGKDAAVNWPDKDLKFKNNTNETIYLKAELNSKKKVVIGVYGKQLDDGVTIKIESKRTGTTSSNKARVIKDSSLAPGERKVVEGARKGYRATAYKVYYDKNGNEIKREEFVKSSYPASGGVVKVGR